MNNETSFEQPQLYYNLISDVFGGNGKGTYFAGGCTGCEKLARSIDEKHLDNVYKMGLEL